MARRTGAWWWIDRWRKSTAYSDMTLAEQGAYRNLLDELWLRGGLLPLDERVLAKVSGDAVAWPKVRAKVMARFTKKKDGWRHDTHDEVSLADSAFRVAQSEKGKKGAEARWHPNKDDGPANSPAIKDDGPASGRSDGPSDGLRTPYSVSGSVSDSEEGRKEGRPAGRDLPPNPLVNRDALVREGYALIVEIAPIADLDPSEVLHRASGWKGHGYVRLDSMPDDRLAQTLVKLRTWVREVRGEPEPQLPERSPPTSPTRAAQARQDSMAAFLRGGLEAHADPDLAGGPQSAGSSLPGSGPDRGGAGGEGPALPAAPRRPDR